MAQNVVNLDNIPGVLENNMYSAVDVFYKH